MRKLNCKTCGAELFFDIKSGLLKCDYCGSTFKPSDYDWKPNEDQAQAAAGDEVIEQALRDAKAYSDAYNHVPLITVNSWNEWTETSYLEPDSLYGYGYLEAVRKVFKTEL